MDIIKKYNIQIYGAEEKPLLFVNGFGCTQTVWRELADNFSSRHQIIRFDHVGTGGASTLPFSKEKYSDLTAYADDIIEICQFLALGKVTLIGHSIGAMMGVLAAIKAPELFQSLILITPSPRHLNDTDYRGGMSEELFMELMTKLDNGSSDWAEYMSPLIMMNEERSQLTNELVEMLCSMPNDVMGTFAHTTFMNDSRPYLDKLTLPTFIIQTEEDRLITSEATQLLLNKIPQVSIKFLADEGHCPHISNPELVATAIKSLQPLG